nr:hypothetical protein GCM10017745_26950 [Saccharothrix mutabilis subsp. capreolus]
MNRRVVGAVALGVGAVLAVCGSLLELFRAEFRVGPDRVDSQVLTAWRTTFEFSGAQAPETFPGGGGGTRSWPPPCSPWWGSCCCSGRRRPVRWGGSRWWRPAGC